MSRLFRRTRRARDASSEPGEPALSEPYAAHESAAHRGDTEPLPAGLDLDRVVGEAPTTRRRGKLRARLRHLRKVRELLLRDLGGLVFEIHRVGTDDAGDAHGRLVARKLSRLAGVDIEIRELEDALGDRRPTVLREPGIGGACGNCGELYGSMARFCWACGTAVAPGHGRRAMAPAPHAGYAQLAAPAPAPVAPAPPPPDEPAVAPLPFVDSEAHPLGEQPTERMEPVPDDARDEQPTVPFDPPSAPPAEAPAPEPATPDQAAPPPLSSGDPLATRRDQ